MKIILLMGLLLLGGLLVACGSDPAPTNTLVPTSTPAPTATAVPTARPTATSPAPGEPTPRATHPLQSVVQQQEEEREDQGEAVQGGVLRLLGSDPPTLDPHQAGDVSSSRYILEVFGGLLTINPDLEMSVTFKL